jgi:uncharacterized phiE125 gp8 family phage protein
MKRQQITFPDAINVISLATAKNHLRVEHSSDDALITSLITASQDVVQQYTGDFMQRTAVNFYSDTFMDFMDLHGGTNLFAIVLYINAVSGTTVAAVADYQLDGKSYPSRLRMMKIPDDVKDQLNAVTVQTISGYDTDDRPQALVSAMLLIIGHLYENRQDVGRFKHHEIPMASKYLMEPYRLKSFR